MTVGGSVLLAVLVEQLRAVVRPDAIAQVIEQFDHGEGLLRRPNCCQGNSRKRSRAGARLDTSDPFHASGGRRRCKVIFFLR